jgi:hypothetical protein
MLPCSNAERFAFKTNTTQVFLALGVSGSRQCSVASQICAAVIQIIEVDVMQVGLSSNTKPLPVLAEPTEGREPLASRASG